MNIKYKQAHSSNFSVGRMGPIKYIVVHYTGNHGDTAYGNCSYFQNNVVRASANYFVDDMEVWCSVNPTDTSWHCGGGPYLATRPSHFGLCTNQNSISVEICSERDTQGNYYFTEETEAHAVEVVRWLMNKHEVDIHHVIRHYDVSGKPCPAPFLSTESWEGFLEAIIDMSIDTLYDYEKVQHRCGFADATMQYLLDYKYGDILIKRLADTI